MCFWVQSASLKFCSLTTTAQNLMWTTLLCTIFKCGTHFNCSSRYTVRAVQRSGVKSWKNILCQHFTALHCTLMNISLNVFHLAVTNVKLCYLLGGVNIFFCSNGGCHIQIDYGHRMRHLQRFESGQAGVQKDNIYFINYNLISQTTIFRQIYRF